MILKRHSIALLAFCGIACLAMYWIIFNLSTSMPGDKVTDYYHFHWNFWWVRHVLTTPGLNIYETNYVFAPATSSLAFHTLSLFWYPVWAVVEPLGGTFLATTVISIIAFTLNGYLFFVLLRREGVSYGLALVGGVMLELSPMLFNALNWTNLNLYGWFWIPALILIWGQIADTVSHPRSSRFQRPLIWALILALVLWMMILTDIQYPLFAFFIIVPYGLLKVWQTKTWRGRLTLLGYGFLGVMLGLALLWFAGPLPYILSFDRTGLAPTPADRAVKVPFPWGFIWHYKPDVNTPIGAVALPSFLIALVVNLWVRRSPNLRLRKMRWFWAVLAPAPLILSAGAYIMIGDSQITMPYVWLHDLLGGMFRYPERFAPVFLIPAVLFVMMTLTPILERRKKFFRLLVPAAFLFIVVADSWMLKPLLIQPQPKHYDFYAEMGKEPYDYVVVEVPTGGSSGEGIVGDPAYSALEFYGTIHGKRMVNGHISRVNTYRYTYMLTDDPMLSWLGQRIFLDPVKVRQQLEERIPSWPIGYIVIHRDMIWHDGPTIQEILGFFNSQSDLVCPVWVEGDAVVYRTVWHPGGCPPRIPPESPPGDYTIDIGADDDARYTGQGWYFPEEIIPGLMARWTGEFPEAKVYVDLPAGAYQLDLSAQSFYRPRNLEVLVNGTSIGSVTVSESGLKNYQLSIPADVIGNGNNLTITLAYDSTDTPKSVGAGDSDRKLAILVDQIQFKKVSDES
ncbi:MAG: hypothetical protein ABI690_06405 [Chloroflexota bacterium]